MKAAFRALDSPLRELANRIYDEHQISPDEAIERARGALTMTDATSVGEDFPRQQQRVRDVLRLYEDLGPAGRFGAMWIRDLLRRAEAAAIGGDVVEIVRVYQELRDVK